MSTASLDVDSLSTCCQFNGTSARDSPERNSHQHYRQDDTCDAHPATANENHCHCCELGNKQHEGINNVATEAGHFNTIGLGNGLNHEAPHRTAPKEIGIR